MISPVSYSPCVIFQILRLTKEMETEIEDLKTHRRELEFHIERTDQWAENIGKWKAHIYNSEVSGDYQCITLYTEKLSADNI
jgi:hypothetical protein